MVTSPSPETPPTKRTVLKWVAGSLLASFGSVVLAVSLGQLVKRDDATELLSGAIRAISVASVTSVVVALVIAVAAVCTRKGKRKETWLWLLGVSLVLLGIGVSTSVSLLLTAGLVLIADEWGPAIVTALGAGLLAWGAFLTRGRLKKLWRFVRTTVCRRRGTDRAAEPEGGELVKS